MWRQQAAGFLENNMNMHIIFSELFYSSFLLKTSIVLTKKIF